MKQDYKKIVNLISLQFTLLFIFFLVAKILGWLASTTLLLPAQICFFLIPINLILLIFNLIFIFYYQPKDNYYHVFKWLALIWTILLALFTTSFFYVYITFSTNLLTFLLIFVFIGVLVIHLLVNHLKIKKLYQSLKLKVSKNKATFEKEALK